ncbi:sushi domain-containing protein 1-like isoform x6 [Plakobranchus ocellatus]|uniref:Sushi domain-containing protein 1-like isoform x6 n=1 Tax=Plakobranchus ocellatus TaxID=259542 RepID=A0AAV4C0J2_9GAST|nr:sushi domain-containing protein 1-like isoform x6 [Plakobranchus ocellatus]
MNKQSYMQSTSADSVATYDCMVGAAPRSPIMSTTCQVDSGRWSPIPKPCHVVTCGQPPIVDTMDVDLATRSHSGAYPGLDAEELKMAYGGQAMYTCKDGYTSPPESSHVSQCQADGTWSSTDSFQCNPTNCGDPPEIANSSTTIYMATTFGENATVTCSEGFKPLDGFTLTCDKSGTWAGAEVTCDPIDCGLPPSRNNATVEYGCTMLNSTAKHSCIEPTVVQGEDNSTAICQNDEEWSSVSLTCFQFRVEIFPPWPTVKWSTGGRVQCFVFGELVFWGREIIQCESMSCGDAPDVANANRTEMGQRHPSTVTYVCSAGFSLTSADDIRICKPDGTWSSEEVVCSPVTCDPPTLAENIEL